MNRWDVYWADVPFEEDALRGKRRPVVIASDRTVYVLVLRLMGIRLVRYLSHRMERPQVPHICM